MRSKFIGYYRGSIDKECILKNATIVVDTNVLLDIYRYSSDTAKQILMVLNQVKNKLWMPYQVAYEYHKNLYGEVLGNHVRKYSNHLKILEKFNESFNNDREFPFLPEADYREMREHLDKIFEILRNGRENCRNLIKDNEYIDAIADLFENKLGNDYPKTDKENYIKEAHERYKYNIPPGYKDSKKDNNECGDYLIWRQMIDYAKTNHCPIVFVTNDIKEDWITEVAGIKLGPRPELIAEFYNDTEQYFYCYNLKQFIDTLSNNEKLLGKEAIEEIENYIERTYTDEQIMGEAEPTSSQLETYMGDIQLDIPLESGV